jgi:hypothetical protein
LVRLADYQPPAGRLRQSRWPHVRPQSKGGMLDTIGRKYARFRTGVALKGLEKQRDRS